MEEAWLQLENCVHGQLSAKQNMGEWLWSEYGAKPEGLQQDTWPLGGSSRSGQIVSYPFQRQRA